MSYFSWFIRQREIRVIAYACSKPFNECNAVVISDGTSEKVKVSSALNFLPIGGGGVIISALDGAGITKKSLSTVPDRPITYYNLSDFYETVAFVQTL